MVPLRSVCQDLIGGKVSFDSKTKSTSIVFDGKNVEFSVGSKTAKANGKTIQMDTVPALKDGHIFVPIKLLIDNLGLKSSWNSEYGFVHIDDERITHENKDELIPPEEQSTYDFMHYNHVPHTGGIRQVMGFQPDQPDTIRDAFAPIGAKLTKVEDNEGLEKWYAKAELKNITGKDIPEGKSDCQIQFFDSIVNSKKPPYGCTFQNGKHMPAVKKDEIIKNSTYTRTKLGRNNEKLCFIVMVGKAKK